MIPPLRHPFYSALTVALVSSLLLNACSPSPTAAAASSTPVAESASTAKPALSVSLIAPRVDAWSQEVHATGNVAAWQESAIGTEVAGLRLSHVAVNVGDRVRRGQVLARLDPAVVQVDRLSSQAVVAEARANLAQARLNADRAERLSPTGALSKQEIFQYETQLKTAEAKLEAAQAQLAAQTLRLSFTTLSAPDDGIISARNATQGTVVQAGSELFRLIRQGRLEWRAEVKGETLLQLKPGQLVVISHPLGGTVQGTVRQVSPTVDTATRNGMVYVDLPANANLKAGMFVSGALRLAESPALHVPRAALASRDGYTYAFKVDAAGRVQSAKVLTGRTLGDNVEVVDGLTGQDRVVASGAGFLKSGDLVRVVETPAAAATAAASDAPSMVTR